LRHTDETQLKRTADTEKHEIITEEGLDNLVYQGNKNRVTKFSSKLCKNMHFKNTRAGSHHLETRREGDIQ